MCAEPAMNSVALETSAHLRRILDSVADGIYGVDAVGLTTFINLAAIRLLGWSAEDFEAQDQHELLHAPSDAVSAHSPEACPVLQTLRDGKPREVAHGLLRRSNGGLLPVRYSVLPLGSGDQISGAVVTFSDLTSQQRAEEEARRALTELVEEQAARAEAESMRRQLHRLFEQVPALVALTFGPDHVFELVNPPFSELIAHREVVGKPYREALPEVAGEFAPLLDQVYQTRETYAGNEVFAELQTPAGIRGGYYNFVFQPILGASGSAYGILIHAVEVTELVQSRRLMEEKAAELAALAGSLERTNRELDQFAYIASHDLKAPLRGVSNIASWLEEDLADKLAPETRQYMILMRNRIERMESLIDALLSYSRAGRVQGEPRVIDLTALVNDLIAMVSENEAKPVQVVLERKLPEVLGDPVGLQQVFQNLMGNAVKYAQSVVRVGVRDAENEHLFYVADDGPGIDPRFHDRVWGMFQRLHAPGEGEGTGIGLAIVKKIVDANHGRVWLESELGQGATFWVGWPKNLAQGVIDG